MNLDYIEIGKATDIKDPKERRIYRMLEILPGFLSLSTLILVVLFSWLKPFWVAVFIILFCFYYLIKTFYLSILQVASYKKMKEYLKIDWQKKLEEIPKWEEIYHLVLLPTYKEGKEIIKTSLEALIKTSYPKEKMIVVLAQEERAGEDHNKEIKEAVEDYKDKFLKLLITVHPSNILGEIAGKGSNTHFAINEAKKIIDELKIKYENVIVSSFDVDTQVYPQFFSCLTYHYLTTFNNLRASFQPIPVYHNNIFSAPAFSRVVSTSNTFWQMVQQSQPETLVTYSSHSFPLKTILEVGYPKNVVSDDSRVFWKSFFYYNGDYRVEPLFYPVSMDTVLSENLLRTIINQYRQQRRWAWGCNEIPYLIYGCLKNKKVPFFKKFLHIYNMVDGFWSWATAAILIFTLGWLPLLLGGEKFNFTILSYNLPRTLSLLMTIALVGLFVSAGLNVLLLPPHPKKNKKISVIIPFLLQWVLLPFTLIFFGSIPALESQIRLMLGKYLGLWVTEKFRYDLEEVPLHFS
jgi:hypothetical protein